MRIGATVLLLAVAGTGFAQAPAKKFAAFDVTSVKVNAGNEPATIMVKGGYFHGVNSALFGYIGYAYNLNNYQRTVLQKQVPDWVNSTKYDVEARVDGEPTVDDMRRMMRALLAERAKVTVHSEMQEATVLDVSLVKPGKMGLAGRNVPMAAIVNYIPSGGRAKVDKTELTENYDFTLEFGPDGTPGANADAPTLLEALAEQLGLKLTANKGQVEVAIRN